MEKNIEITPVNEPEPQKNIIISFFKEIFDWSESILTALITVVILMTFIARVTVVDGDSMLPTLIDREFLILSNLIDEYTYNDIIVLKAKNLVNEDFESGKPIVKRIIGLPGDRIRIDEESGLVYRNGEVLEVIEKDGKLIEEGYYINSYTNNDRDMTGEIVVPMNSYFVLGDNREISMDSRNIAVGSVDEHYIVGKAIFRILPFNKIGSVY